MEERDVSAYRWITLLLATSVQIGVSILQQAPAALGPILATDLGLARAQIGLLSSAIWSGMLVTMLPAGLLIDRHGERRIILVGVPAMVLMVLAATQVATFVWLFVFFLVASLGASSSAPGGSKAIAAWFPRSQRGRAMGVRQTGVAIGGLLAALLLPPAAVRFGWEVGLQLAAAVTLVTVLCFAVFYRERAAEKPHEENEDSEPGSVRERVAAALGSRSFFSTTGYAFVFMGVQGSAASFLALYLAEELRFPVVVAGALFAVFQVGGMVGRIGWGVVSDRTGRRGPMMLLVGAMVVLCCLALAFFGGNVGLAPVAILAFLFGCSAMGWNGLYLTALAESAPIQKTGTTMGASLTLSFLGMFLVPPLFGLISDTTGSFYASWLALAGWACLGTLLGLSIRKL